VGLGSDVGKAFSFFFIPTSEGNPKPMKKENTITNGKKKVNGRGNRL
jgi:hypothetical protein